MRIPLQDYWNLLARYLVPQRLQVIGLAALLLGEVALQLLTPQIVRSFLDTATTGGPITTLLGLAALFIGIGLANQSLAVLTVYTGTNIGWIATNNLRADLAEHCLRLDLSFHHAHTPGEMIERLDGDLQALSNFLSQFAVRLLGNLLLIFGVLALLLWEEWRVGAPFVVFTIVILFVLHRIRDAATPYWQAGRQASAELFGFLEERFGGIADIRANGANSYVLRRFAEAIRAEFRRSRGATVIGFAVGSGAELLLVLGSVGALAIGAMLFRSGALTIGTVYLITAYASLLVRPLKEMIYQIDDLQKAGASIARVEEIASLQPAIQDGVGAAISSGALAVAFRDVSFAYVTPKVHSVRQATTGEHAASEEQPTIPPTVLKHISFQIAPGEVLGLIGRTGSGKTTLTRLLLRLYDPDAGAITLNGTDIRMARLDDLRGRIGMVTQDVQLFHASVRDNLTLFDHSIADDHILGVIHELGLQAWYAALPQGLNTMLNAGGGVSAGEAQMLTVARIFLKDPGLIILDEASSRLDPATEHLLERALNRLFAGRTGIIIAHRLRTVQRVNTIMLLEDGRIGEHGPREALARDPHSRFHQLLRLGSEEVLQ